MTALALMGLLPDGAIVSGALRFEGRDLARLGEAEMRKLRGDRIAMIFQEPMTALNPLHPIGRQVAEPLRQHKGMGRRAARAEAEALLERVGIEDAASRLDLYPHQLSGGQRQRVMIAAALACGPELLIADEPTTALDVSVQAQILDLLMDLVEERGMGLLLISHDLGIIAETCERALVLYGGLVVESGPIAALIEAPAHPYTRGLLAALPQAGGGRLTPIPGSVPQPGALPPGCPFAPRCAIAIARCLTDRPPFETLSPGHRAACHRLEEARALPGRPA
jgi:peptide/nickel transport system ATP-binding protein